MVIHIYTDKTNIPNFTLEEIENMFKLKFNLLVADCEGCLDVFFKENEELLSSLRLIIFEADKPNICNYDTVLYYLNKYNYEPIYVLGKQFAYKRI